MLEFLLSNKIAAKNVSYINNFKIYSLRLRAPSSERNYQSFIISYETNKNLLLSTITITSSYFYYVPKPLGLPEMWISVCFSLAGQLNTLHRSEALW